MMGRKEKTILVTIIANIILIILRFFLADISGVLVLQQMHTILSPIYL